MSTFYCIDLDRTLFDTPAMTRQILEVAARYDEVAAAMLLQKADDDYARGYPFAIRQQIELHFGAEQTALIEAEFLATASPESLLLEGANETLASMGETHFGIFTFGEPLGQMLKLRSAGLTHLPYVITDQREKGSIIAGWRQQDGSYMLPSGFGGSPVQRIALIDDRLISFQGLPADAKGYWVASQPPTTAQISILPQNVVPVRTLLEFVQTERLIDKS